MSVIAEIPSDVAILEDGCRLNVDSDNNLQEGEDLNALVDNENNASREDTVAKLEHALSRKLKMEEQNGNTTSNGNNQDIIDFDEDPRALPGYTEPPEDCPQWKKAMIERKNKELEEKAKAELRAQKAEEDKWKGVPEWKKKIIMEKQKKIAEVEALQNEDSSRKMEEEIRFQQLPKWKQDILLKKKQQEN